MESLLSVSADGSWKAGAGRIDDKLPAGGDTVAHFSEFRCCYVRPNKVEFVIDAVERAVSDEHKREIVFCFSIAGHSVQRLFQLCPRRLCAGQRVDVRRGAFGPEDSV